MISKYNNISELKACDMESLFVIYCYTMYSEYCHILYIIMYKQNHGYMKLHYYDAWIYYDVHI